MVKLYFCFFFLSFVLYIVLLATSVWLLASSNICLVLGVTILFVFLCCKRSTDILFVLLGFVVLIFVAIAAIVLIDIKIHARITFFGIVGTIAITSFSLTYSLTVYLFLYSFVRISFFSFMAWLFLLTIVSNFCWFFLLVLLLQSIVDRFMNKPKASHFMSTQPKV